MVRVIAAGLEDVVGHADGSSRYRADDRTQREESELLRRFTYDELSQRDKANLDIFCLRDESLEDSENLPPPDEFAAEIMEDLRAALEQLEEIAGDLGVGVVEKSSGIALINTVHRPQINEPFTIH